MLRRLDGADLTGLIWDERRDRLEAVFASAADRHRGAHLSAVMLDLAAQTVSAHHGYPDGAMLFLGTMFAPVEDRHAPGQGFTHVYGDRVTISAPKLGALVNRMRRTDACERWTFGAGALMRNLARRGLLA